MPFPETGPRPAVDALPLPHRLFLLSQQPGKGRLDADSEPVRGTLLVAAAVAELRIAGLLHDRDGKAAQTQTTTPVPLDPFVAAVLGDVPPGRPRNWFELLEHGWDKAEDKVRDGLATGGFITVEHRQIFGPFRSRRIGVTDPGQVGALRNRVRAAVGAGSTPAPASLEDAVLATLAVDGLVGTMFRWRELRTHQSAIRAVADRIDQELPNFRKPLSYSIAVRRGG